MKRTKPCRFRVSACAAAALALLAAAPVLAADEPVSFAKQIHPLLNKYCVGCHSPAMAKSGLVLSNYAAILKGGGKGPAVVAGKPDESVIVAYLTGKSTPRMPFGGQPLAADQIALVTRWIAEGAKNDGGDETTEIKIPDKPTVYHAPPVITAMAWSPDGKLLAISGYHEILLHDGEKLVARLAGRSERIHAVAFSPDGATLAAVGGNPAQFGELQVWDVASRKPLHSAIVTNDTLFGLSFSPDGTRVAFGATDKSIRIYDVHSGKELRKMDHHEDWVFGTAFGMDGKRLVSVSRDRAAKLTDANTGAFIENVNLLKEPLAAVVRYPKKDWVLIGGAERIPYLYRMDRPRAMRIADDSTLIRKYGQQDGPILALAISPDGQYIAVGSEVGPVRVYNTETGAVAGDCAGHQGGIYALAFKPNGSTLETAGFDGTVRSYDMTGKLVRAFVPVPIDKTLVSQK